VIPLADTIIETTTLTRRYATFTAVDSLNLNVAKGSVFGFLGPNGAGKTTTIRMLLGLIKPTIGQITLFGGDMTDRRQRGELLRRIGALVEMPALYPTLTGRENLEITRRLLGAAKSRIGAVLHIVNLQDAADRPTKGYSLGMKQRLGLALALLNEPDLLILDEPTNGLDPAGIHEMRDLIRRLPVDHGITVFLSSHLLSEVEQMATHVGIVNHGKLLFQDTLEALQAQRPMRLALGVKQPEPAIKWLQSAGWQIAEQRGPLLYINAHSQDDAAKINGALIGLGIDVHHVNLEQPTLETIFLQMTGTPREGQATQ
jgi:lantibiotic transport system ATP-binding protein